MKIIKVEKLKNSKYKIITDRENIITFDNVILNNNLLYKKEIDEELYKIIINDTEYYDIYNKAVRYLLRKRRSEKEVREYLIKCNLSKTNINKMIAKLKDNNLINDVEYSKAFINDSMYLGKYGANKIRNELLKKDISPNVIENELNNIDVEYANNKLEKLIMKKITLNKKYSNKYIKQKILNKMLNLGYNKEEIIKILDNNINDDYSIMKNEFEKLYIKLSKKYTDYELIKHIKNKMLMKGFNIDYIEELLKEKTEK